MSPEERWNEIVNELLDIAELKVIAGDPATREEELFAELDELEMMYGQDFERRLQRRSSQ